MVCAFLAFLWGTVNDLYQQHTLCFIAILLVNPLLLLLLLLFFITPEGSTNTQ